MGEVEVSGRDPDRNRDSNRPQSVTGSTRTLPYLRPEVPHDHAVPRPACGLGRHLETGDAAPEGPGAQGVVVVVVLIGVVVLGHGLPADEEESALRVVAGEDVHDGVAARRSVEEGGRAGFKCWC